MYTTQFCPYCVRAKQLLASKDASVKEVRVDLNPEERAKMMRLSGRRTVPQIWIGDTHVGGFDELWALDRKGELEPLLESVST
jgi:glutaredoxin 3|tara:strand:- start:611 stop:859 length:249 start_codon:yes stop_codon:yes gene_type:complete